MRRAISMAGICLVAMLVGSPIVRAHAQANGWAWMGGASRGSQDGVYGTKGVAGPANVPGSRYTAVTWTDHSGNLWLFGGEGFSPATGISSIHFNDLWEFSPSSKEWTWASGTDTGANGTYGTRGVAAANNVPGSRAGGVGWTDANGDLWLFGGWGYDSAGNFGSLNDLWRFNIPSGEWTWMGGSATLPDNNDSCQAGVFGARGTAAATNVPSGSYLGAAWTDNSGNLWLFPGGSCDSSGNQGLMNTLWKYSPSTNQWTWVSGGNAIYQAGVYGTVGVPSAANVPGARWGLTAWTDPEGNFWLFGGEGKDGAVGRGYLNDVWEFNPSLSQWTWVSGSNSVGTDNCYQPGVECAPSGVYGTLGQSAAGNVPDGRTTSGAADKNGNLWLFGGYNEANGLANLFNDLWVFNIQSKQWAWMSGSNTVTCGVKDSQGRCVIDGQAGVYGTAGVPAAGNLPGSRNHQGSWSDASGNLWLFGGNGLDAAGNPAYLNDLWVYEPLPPPTFTMAASATTLSLQSGAQGTLTLTITPQNGFNAAVSFACSGLPSGASCAFSPLTVTPSGSAANTSLTITAETITVAVQPRSRPFAPQAILALALCFIVWPWRRGLRVAGFVIVVAGAGLLIGCGGSGARSKCTVPVPPPVSSTVTVTATAGSLQQTVTVALAVYPTVSCN